MEQQQSEIIEQILQHGGLWDPPEARDPPAAGDPEPALASNPEAHFEPDPEYLEHLWESGELTEVP
jgi:hypothetical protein